MGLFCVYHEEGRATPSGTSWQYEYYLKDHLGNTRVIFTDSDDNGEPEIIQEADYYPFGMRHDRVTTATNHYLYNGKELNEDLGLDWYDYGARWLDVETGRWSTIDPLAENYASMSPFNYVANNPITNIDPDGMRTIFYTEDGRELLRTYDNLDNAIVVIPDYSLSAVELFNNMCFSSEDDKARVMRELGTNYMVDGMIKLLNLSLRTPVRDEEWYDKDGNVLNMYSEYRSRMDIENNKIEVIFDFESKVTHTAYSTRTVPLLGGAETIGIHTHPSDFRPDVYREKTLGRITIPLGGSPGAPPSGSYDISGDRGNKKEKTSSHGCINCRYYDAVVSPTNIWLYRYKKAHYGKNVKDIKGVRTKMTYQEIKVPLNFFK